jgi:hypothetical protein
VMRLALLKKIVNKTVKPFISAFSVGIILSRLAANRWPDGHQWRNQNSSSVTIRKKE